VACGQGGATQGAAVELARVDLGGYQSQDGERFLTCQRISGSVHVFDHPRTVKSNSYFVEAGFRSVVELAVLVGHYKRQAELLGLCPMSREGIAASLRS
jgi:hypothetical protein